MKNEEKNLLDTMDSWRCRLFKQHCFFEKNDIVYNEYVGDIIVVYYDEDGMVTNEKLKETHLDRERFMMVAQANTWKEIMKNKVQISSVQDVIMQIKEHTGHVISKSDMDPVLLDLLEDEDDEEFNIDNIGFELPLFELPLYYLSGNGATVMLFSDILAKVSEAFDSNLYIIPSSVLELLVVPDGEGNLLEDIGYIIPLVNKGMDETEVLSNFLYYYDNTTHQVSICESNVMNYLK